MEMKWISQEEVTTPPDCSHLLYCKDHWWVSNDDGQILVAVGTDKYYYPQANENKSIVERRATREQEHGATGVIFIPHAFLRDSPSRYV